MGFLRAKQGLIFKLFEFGDIDALYSLFLKQELVRSVTSRVGLPGDPRKLHLTLGLAKWYPIPQRMKTGSKCTAALTSRWGRL